MALRWCRTIFHVFLVSSSSGSSFAFGLEAAFQSYHRALAEVTEAKAQWQKPMEAVRTTNRRG